MIKGFSIFLFLIAGGVLSWYWTKPALEEIDKLKVELSATQKTLADSRELQELRDNLLERYGSVSSEDLDKLSKLIPKSPEITKLFVEIENLAKEAGVTIKNMNGTEARSDSSGASKEELVYNKAVLSLTVSASYESLKAFLERLQKSLRLISITKINFSAAEKNFYEFTIDAESYFKE